MFPSVPNNCISLLRGLLEFNPHFRLSAKDALKSTLFDNIRIKHFEQPCQIQINQNIYTEGAYDYDKFKDLMFGLKEYKTMLLEE